MGSRTGLTAIPAPKAPEEIADYLEKIFESTENVTDELVKLGLDECNEVGPPAEQPDAS